MHLMSDSTIIPFEAFPVYSTKQKLRHVFFLTENMYITDSLKTYDCKKKGFSTHDRIPSIYLAIKQKGCEYNETLCKPTCGMLVCDTLRYKRMEQNTNHTKFKYRNILKKYVPKAST